MNTLIKRHLIYVALLGVFIVPAQAELRCDCSQVVDSCSAEVSFDEDGSEVEIETSTDACARVDYLVEGQPFTALVVEGEAEFDWDGNPQAKPQIIVENCRVCVDSVAGNAPKPKKAPLASGDIEKSSGDGEGPRALVKVMPDYPRTAWRSSIEGTVTVEFSVSEEGIVQNIKVVESTSPVFVTPTIDAVSRFRYTEAAADGLRETFTFRLLDGVEPVVSSTEM